MTQINSLIEGYREFYKQYFASGDTLYQDLSVGQSPQTLIIACSDSRVDPSIITSAGPGDIFVVRNVANLVPPFETRKTGHHGVSAALEFAVRMLEVKDIIILGHSQCAGIKALIDSDTMEQTDFIQTWMDIARPVKTAAIQNAPEADAESLQPHCEQAGILLSLSNLMTFPWIAEKVQSGQLNLHGWYFSLTDGGLKEYDPASGQFETVG